SQGIQSRSGVTEEMCWSRRSGGVFLSCADSVRVPKTKVNPERTPHRLPHAYLHSHTDALKTTPEAVRREFGRVCCGWRDKFKAQGNHQGKGFLQLCKTLEIPQAIMRAIG